MALVPILVHQAVVCITLEMDFGKTLSETVTLFTIVIKWVALIAQPLGLVNVPSNRLL